MEHRCLCTSAGHCRWHNTVTTPEEFLACRNGTPPTPAPDESHCVYLSDQKEDLIDGYSYRCNLYKVCTLLSNNSAIPACADCKDNLSINDASIGQKFLDPLVVTDRAKTPTHALRGMLANRAAFLVCGGPSAKLVDYHRLSDRGIFSLGVNNIAGMVPVNAFVCSDPPMKFHWGIFDDPQIMKFLPIPKLGGSRGRGMLREKRGETFHWLDLCAKDCPNVWGFARRSWLTPDHTFFTDTQASWGNQQSGVSRTGEEKTACTMLLGIRLLYYLGARTIFLLGCDFHMRPEAGLKENYAFGQDRDANTIASNNRQLKISGDWLTRLRPYFEKFGLQIYNCYRESHLRAFDFVPFESALGICRGVVPKGEFDLDGWYSKETEGDSK